MLLRSNLSALFREENCRENLNTKKAIMGKGFHAEAEHHAHELTPQPIFLLLAPSKPKFLKIKTIIWK